MRDGAIYGKLSTVNQKLTMACRQTAFIDTRLQAFEAVFVNLKWWHILFSRKAVLKRINNLHIELMKSMDETTKTTPRPMDIIRPNGMVP